MNRDKYRQTPVILLAFANDKPDSEGYLRDLRKERLEIVKTLSKAIRNGLCQIKILPNTTVESLLNVFQDDEYRGRIAIFHYGGHAKSYKLLLESSKGGLAAAYRDGLSSFLATQNGLKFVFLNACSTEQHAKKLSGLGVPAVVGTSQKISDEIAFTLAVRFYNGISNGLPLERSWIEAEQQIKISEDVSGEVSDFYTLYHQSVTTGYDLIPWNIYFRKGAEIVKSWNLPEAANNPLFGLPDIPDTYKVPETPFRFLKRYEKEDAKIFFGRSYHIRQIYNCIENPEESSVILLHGQSGVGKSSLLEAGIIPRLENAYAIIYCRRSQNKGLSETLTDNLDGFIASKLNVSDKEQDTIVTKWSQIEQNTRKPLLFILDQVEEMYTRPNSRIPNELEQLIDLLKLIFNNTTNKPQGKLILSYRKEFHSEIKKGFSDSQLAGVGLFLEPLKRKDIIDVVTGIPQTPELKANYNFLSVEDDLPGIIADDLMEDPNSPIAPVLQILLTKMWQSNEKKASITFTLKDYHGFKRKGIAMEDFFKQQMSQLKKVNPISVDTGLALDLLKYHTTDLATSCTRDLQSFKQHYRRKNDIDLLVQQLKDLYLLTQMPLDEKSEFSLAHDTLAPVVIKEYNDSDKPGQRASRIITAKMDAFRQNKHKTFLDEVDLATVESGQKGMRALSLDEEYLLSVSRKRRTKRKIIFGSVVAAFVIFTLVVSILWIVVSKEKRTALANYYAAQTRILIDRREPAQAIGYAAAAYKLDPNPNVTQVLSEVAGETLTQPFFNTQFQHDYHVNTAVFSPDGNNVLTASADNTAKLWDLKGKLLRRFEHDNIVLSASFSPDGNNILTVSNNQPAKLWDLHSFHLKDLEHGQGVTLATFSPDGKYIISAGNDNTCILWDSKGKPLKELRFRNKVNLAQFSPDSTRILTVSKDQNAWLLDTNGMPIKGQFSVNWAGFSPSGKMVVFILTNNKIKLWHLPELKGLEINHLKVSQVVHHVALSPDDKLVLIAYLGGAVEIKTLDSQKVLEFGLHKDNLTSAQFLKDSTRILTTSRDNTAKLWDINGRLIYDFHLHDDFVFTAVCSPDGSRILTASRDSTAKLWDLKDQLMQEFSTYGDNAKYATFSPDGDIVMTISGKNVKLWPKRHAPITLSHKDDVNCAQFSPDGKLILTGSTDFTAKLWDLKGKELVDFNQHTNNVNDAVFSPDGRMVLTASYDETARLWNLDGKCLHLLKHPADVISAVFSPDGDKILTACFDETARLWDTQGSLLMEFKNHYGQVNIAQFSPDGSKILTVAAGARIWDLNGNLIAELNSLKSLENKQSIDDTYSVNDAVFSSNGKYIITAESKKRAILWNLKGELIKKLDHLGKVTSVRFSRDSSLIITISADNTVRLWNLQGELLHIDNSHSGHVYSAEFSRDGYRILTASADQTVKLRYTPEGIVRWLKKSSNLLSPPLK